MLVNCVICNKEMKISPCRLKTIKTCSKECSIKNKVINGILYGKQKVEWITKKCPICQKEYQIVPARKNTNTYCSKKCNAIGSAPSRSKGKTYRHLIKSECELCGHNGENSRLEVHHLDKNRTNNNITNLKTVCVKCHHNIYHPESLFKKGHPHKKH